MYDFESEVVTQSTDYDYGISNKNQQICVQINEMSSIKKILFETSWCAEM